MSTAGTSVRNTLPKYLLNYLKKATTTKKKIRCLNYITLKLFSVFVSISEAATRGVL